MFIERQDRGYIYRLTFPNGKCYIGQTYDFIKRIYWHLVSRNDRRAKRMNLAFSTGVPYAEIIFVSRVEDIHEFERQFIDAFGHYNSSHGGERSASRKRKASISNAIRAENWQPALITKVLGLSRKPVVIQPTRSPVVEVRTPIVYKAPIVRPANERVVNSVVNRLQRFFDFFNCQYDLRDQGDPTAVAIIDALLKDGEFVRNMLSSERLISAAH